MILTTELYFECHITIEPVFDQRLQTAADIAKDYNFRLADLLMLKRVKDTPERSPYDTFMTGKDTDYARLEKRMTCLIARLRLAGFVVWRYKIENTIIDSKINDELGILE